MTENCLPPAPRPPRGKTAPGNFSIYINNDLKVIKKSLSKSRISRGIFKYMITHIKVIKKRQK